MKIYRAHRPRAHPDIAHGLTFLLEILTAQNKDAEAHDTLREALHMSREVFPATAPVIAFRGGQLGYLSWRFRRFEAAAALA